MKRVVAANRVVAAAIAVVGLVGVAAGCSDDSQSAASESSSSAPTTTTTTVPTTTQPPLPSEPQSSPSAAATALVQAWRNGDRDAALTVGTAAAVEALFAAGEPGSTQARGCQNADVQPKPQCVYKTGVGELQIRTAPQGDGWIVEQAVVSPD